MTGEIRFLTSEEAYARTQEWIRSLQNISSTVNHTSHSHSCWPGFLISLNNGLHFLLSAPCFNPCRCCISSAQQPVSCAGEAAGRPSGTTHPSWEWSLLTPPTEILRILTLSLTCNNHTRALPKYTSSLKFCTSFLVQPTSLWTSFLFDFNLHWLVCSMTVISLTQVSGLAEVRHLTSNDKVRLFYSRKRFKTLSKLRGRFRGKKIILLFEWKSIHRLPHSQ